jgi:hypothetical protein
VRSTLFFQDVKNADTHAGLCPGPPASWAVFLNDIEWLFFGWAVFIGMTLAVQQGVLIRGAQAASPRRLYDGHSG